MLCEMVKQYFSNVKGLPFFYIVGDIKYDQVLSEFKQNNIIVDRISDFCPKEDKFPSIDDVIDYFRTLDMDYRENKHVLIGLGELMAIRGSNVAEKLIRRLEKTTLGTARVVLLLRHVTSHVKDILGEDTRTIEQQRLYIDQGDNELINTVCTKFAINTNVAKGIKGLLHELEDGHAGLIHFQSELDYSNSLLPITYIRTAFDAVKYNIPQLRLSKEMGEDAQWESLLLDLQKNKSSLDKLLKDREYLDNFEEDFFKKSTGLEYKNWLFFVALKQNYENIQNSYLAYVVAQTEHYEDLSRNILTKIIQIPRKDSRFDKFYFERKKIVRDYPESEIAYFIQENNIDPSECIYHLTDNTRIEREEIIKWVSQNGYIDDISTIYPALSIYLSEYLFNCGKLSDKLTRYFRQYRYLKLENRITPEFMDLVDQNASELLYTRLESRDSAILRIPDDKNSFLLWIDALGVEFLPYISYLAKENGLSIKTDITYVSLPSITSINRGFYDKWSGSRKKKESRLDEIKHKAEGGYFYQPGQAPVHLASELKVIEEAMNYATTELALHKCKQFVIASDHGASRLAVIHHQEEKYETDTKGEHSGRCCKEFPDADLPQAVRENGYFALANYGRFKNSRAANVEVHGGATLEEVVVPVITLALKKQSNLILKLLDENSIYCDRFSGVEIRIYLSDIENKTNVGIVIEGKRYQAQPIDDCHYKVIIPDIKRAKKGISANVHDGDDLIGTIKFDVKGKIAKVNDDFDDLFTE